MGMWPKGLSLTDGAHRLGIARSELCNFLNGKTHITYDIALKLASWGEITADRWMRMQVAHEQWINPPPVTCKRHELSEAGLITPTPEIDGYLI